MDSLTSRQLSEWEAYDRLDPIGTWRDDFRLAYLSSLITNIAISIHGKKGAKHTTPMDFMLDWDVKEKKINVQSVEEQKRILMDLFEVHNKRVAGRVTPPVKKTNRK